MDSLNYKKVTKDKLARLLEIKLQILSSGGDDDEQLLTELETLSNHPDPLTILLTMDEYTAEEFSLLMFNYQAIPLPWDENQANKH